jgi:hypothetical protein
MIRKSDRVSATSSFTEMANDGITGVSAARHEIIPARRGEDLVLCLILVR